MMNDAKVVYNDQNNDDRANNDKFHRDCDISSVLSRPIAPASIAGGAAGVKWRDCCG